MILVSACLLGFPCKYNGGDNRSLAVCAFLEGKDYVPFCPEQAGGLPTPRVPAERCGDRVTDKSGVDRTEAFLSGAEKTLQLCKEYNVTMAILKENSPSCGSTHIYDGTFTGTLIPGMGVTAEYLQKHGICIKSERDF